MSEKKIEEISVVIYKRIPLHVDISGRYVHMITLFYDAGMKLPVPYDGRELQVPLNVTQTVEYNIRVESEAVAIKLAKAKAAEDHGWDTRKLSVTSVMVGDIRTG